MPIRIPVHGIRLERGTETKKMLIAGQFVDRKVPKIVMPPIGKPFEFTQKELDHLREHAPNSVRHPVNESAAPAATDATEDGKSSGEGGGSGDGGEDL
jgi:hypothetical protein